MTVCKTDQKILNKYLNGKTIKTISQTPLRNVRSYVTTDEIACFISTQKEKGKVSSLLAIVAAQKGYSLSINTEGKYLVCLLFP